jgi:hypothetical protein
MKFMKQFLLIAILLLASGSALSQENNQTPHAAYALCTEHIEKDPHKAYEYCSDYLNKYPDDNPKLIEFAGRFVTAYQRISQYGQSVPLNQFAELTPEWAVYRPALLATIPVEDSRDAKYPILIKRAYGSPGEEKLLAKAEAVYQNPETSTLRLLKDWGRFADKNAASPAGEPKWWSGEVDTILGADVVTTEAVIYYYNISQELRNKNGILKANTFTFFSSSLKYEASIKQVDAYERAGKSFTNVYVANMTLTWAQVCGGLCGFGFTRNKIVVLSPSGEIVGMFLDDPVNRRSWVS